MSWLHHDRHTPLPARRPYLGESEANARRASRLSGRPAPFTDCIGTASGIRAWFNDCLRPLRGDRGVISGASYYAYCTCDEDSEAHLSSVQTRLTQVTLFSMHYCPVQVISIVIE